jgi:hypothetical protein
MVTDEAVDAEDENAFHGPFVAKPGHEGEGETGF